MPPSTVRLFLFTCIALLFGGALLVACGAASGQRAANQSPALFNALAGERSCAIDGNPKILRERCVTVNLDLLEGMQAGEKVLLNFFPDAEYVAVLERYEPASPDGYTWIGRIAGVEHSQVTLVVGGGILTGNVTVENELFQVRWVDEPVYGVYQVDRTSYPPEAEPLEPNP